jgi:Tfp pilus assembly protein PilF
MGLEESGAILAGPTFAWQELSQRGVENAAHESEIFLKSALRENPGDSRLMASLAFIEQQHGKRTRDFYRHPLESRPYATTAVTNLGVLDARLGDLQQARQLLLEAFQKAPYQTAIGIDLALVSCSTGHKDEAKADLQRALRFNPDSHAAKQLLANISNTGKSQE